MLYAVGTKIDLRHMNEQKHEAAAEPTRIKGSRLVMPGTKIEFIKMAHDLIVTKITEPSIAIHVAVGA